MDVPGVPGDVVIEAMAGKVLQLQGQLSAVQAEAIQARTELTKQKKLSQQLPKSSIGIADRQGRDGRQGIASFRRGTERSRSESPNMSARMRDRVATSMAALNRKEDEREVLFVRSDDGGSIASSSPDLDAPDTASPSADSLDVAAQRIATTGPIASLASNLALGELLYTESEPPAVSVVVGEGAGLRHVLDGLDKATIVQQTLELRATINELQSRLKDAELQALQVSEEKAIRDVEFEGSARVEIESAQRQIDLLETTLEDWKSEAIKLQCENSELKKRLSSLQLDIQQSEGEGAAAGCPRASLHSPPVSSDTRDEDRKDIETLTEELESVRSLFRAKSVQLQLVTASLESLQSAGILGQTADFGADNPSLRQKGVGAT
jgi:hypothetical protein